MKEVLRTENLAIGYDGHPVMSGLNLTLCKGMVTAMIGRNGAGKSTLIKTLTKTLKPISGTAYIDGVSLADIPVRKMAKLVASISTDSDMAGGLRLHELVGLGRIPYVGRIGFLDKTDRKRIEEAIEAVGLMHKRNSFVGQLSDGERQKGMIARGLVQDTPVIIMDEPFSYLDVAARLEMLDLVNRLAMDEDKAILFSTHEVTQALNMAGKVWMFTKEGDCERIEEGTPEELVAAGAPGRLFPESQVQFDAESWEFRIKTSDNTCE